ncbi:MAG: hypothetical protein AAFY71_20330 [Bacteroidota bacterium]
MKKWGILLLVGLAVSMYCCTLFLDDYQSVTIKGYEVTYPSFLSETDRLSENADLQLQDVQGDIYAVLRISHWDSLRSNKPEEDLNDYFEFYLDNIYKELEGPIISGPDSLFTNGFEGIEGQLSGSYKGNQLHHRITLLQDSTYLFQFLQWAPDPIWENKKEELSVMIDSLHASIKPENSN